jgi:hypothetical protein
LNTRRFPQIKMHWSARSAHLIPENLREMYLYWLSVSWVYELSIKINLSEIPGNTNYRAGERLLIYKPLRSRWDQTLEMHWKIKSYFWNIRQEEWIIWVPSAAGLINFSIPRPYALYMPSILLLYAVHSL